MNESKCMSPKGDCTVKDFGYFCDDRQETADPHLLNIPAYGSWHPVMMAFMAHMFTAVCNHSGTEPAPRNQDGSGML